MFAAVAELSPVDGVTVQALHGREGRDAIAEAAALVSHKANDSSIMRAVAAPSGMSKGEACRGPAWSEQRIAAHLSTAVTVRSGHRMAYRVGDAAVRLLESCCGAC